MKEITQENGSIRYELEAKLENERDILLALMTSDIDSASFSDVSSKIIAAALVESQRLIQARRRESIETFIDYIKESSTELSSGKYNISIDMQKGVLYAYPQQETTSDVIADSGDDDISEVQGNE